MGASIRRVLAVTVLLSATSALPPAADEDCRWDPLLPWPTQQPLQALAYGGGVDVAVGEGGAVAFADDGVAWAPGVSPTTADLRDVIWDGGRFVAVGDEGTVLQSGDGRVWSGGRRLPRGDLRAVVHRDHDYLAVGSVIARSSDLETWELQDPPSSAYLSAVASDGNRAVAIGGVILVSLDGWSWAEVEPPGESHAYQDVIWTGEEFAVLTYRGLLRSADAQGWSFTEFEFYIPGDPSYPRWLLRHSRGQWAMAFTSGGVNFGGSWSQSAVGTWDGVGEWSVPQCSSPALLDLESAPGHWRGLLGDPLGSGWEGLLGSADLQQWAGLSVPRSPIGHLAWNGELYLSVTGSCQLPYWPWDLAWGRMLSSPDLVNWKNEGPGTPLADVFWTGTRWLVSEGVCEGYSRVGTSTDGHAWTWTSPLSEELRPRSFWVAAASSGTRSVLIGRSMSEPGFPGALAAASTDLEHWTIAQYPGYRPNALVWSGEHFIVVGEGGRVGSSADGLTWTWAQLPRQSSLRWVSAGGGTVVAGGWDGWIAVSKDHGLTWSEAATAASGMATWVGDRFVARGAFDYLVESFDGITWSPSDPPPPHDGTVVAVDEGWVLDGYRGLSRRVCGQPEEVPPVAAPRVTVPIAAATTGLAGTTWATDLTVLSPGEGWATVWLREPSQAGWEKMFLPSGAQTELPDVLGRRLSERGRVAPLEVASEHPILVASRTYNRGALGTFGQGIPAIADGDGVAGTVDALLPLVVENAAFRTNLGVVNLGDQALDVAVEVRDAEGAPLGFLSVSVAPRAAEQLLRPVAELGVGPLDGGYALVRAADPGARYLPWMSVVDNGTGDAVFIPPAQPSTDPQVIAAAAHLGGFEGISWRTDLVLVNPNPTAATCEVVALPAAGYVGSTATVDVELPPLAARRIEDVVGSAFAATGAAALLVTPTSGGVAITSRTYSETPPGTVGQAVPVVPVTSALGEAETGFLPGLEESPQFRSNLGLVNLGWDDTTVSLELRQGIGTLIAERVVVVPGRSLVQLNRPLLAAGGEVVSSYAVVSCEQPGTQILAWASIVDNLSGDPQFASLLRLNE